MDGDDAAPRGPERRSGGRDHDSVAGQDHDRTSGAIEPRGVGSQQRALSSVGPIGRETPGPAGSIHEPVLGRSVWNVESRCAHDDEVADGEGGAESESGERDGRFQFDRRLNSIVDDPKARDATTIEHTLHVRSRSTHHDESAFDRDRLAEPVTGVRGGGGHRADRLPAAVPKSKEPRPTALLVHSRRTHDEQIVGDGEIGAEFISGP
jgi:hypothetical protein